MTSGTRGSGGIRSTKAGTADGYDARRRAGSAEDPATAFVAPFS